MSIDRAEFVARYTQDLWPIRSLAYAYGMSRRSVIKLLREEGVEIRTQSQQQACDAIRRAAAHH